MSDEKALVPVEQREVVFYNDTLLAVLVSIEDADEAQVYVPVKPISDALGLRWSGQYERLQRDEVLTEVSKLIRVTRIKPQRGNPDSVCLPIEFIPGWLFGISASRVKAEMREKILRYRRECYKVLAEAFQEGRLTADPDFDALLKQADDDAVQAYQMAMAVVKLARNQILIQAEIKTHREQLEDHGQRLETIEATLGDPAHHITSAQASRISQAVKAVAFELGKTTGRNEFGGVYGELYRRYEINSYKELPTEKYEDAMAWLNAWYQSMTNKDIAF